MGNRLAKAFKAPEIGKIAQLEHATTTPLASITARLPIGCRPGSGAPSSSSQESSSDTTVVTGKECAMWNLTPETTYRILLKDVRAALGSDVPPLLNEDVNCSPSCTIQGFAADPRFKEYLTAQLAARQGNPLSEEMEHAIRALLALLDTPSDEPVGLMEFREALEGVMNAVEPGSDTDSLASGEQYGYESDPSDTEDMETEGAHEAQQAAPIPPPSYIDVIKGIIALLKKGHRKHYEATVERLVECPDPECNEHFLLSRAKKVPVFLWNLKGQRYDSKYESDVGRPWSEIDPIYWPADEEKPKQLCKRGGGGHRPCDYDGELRYKQRLIKAPADAGTSPHYIFMAYGGLDTTLGHKDEIWRDRWALSVTPHEYQVFGVKRQTKWSVRESVAVDRTIFHVTNANKYRLVGYALLNKPVVLNAEGIPQGVNQHPAPKEAKDFGYFHVTWRQWNPDAEPRPDGRGRPCYQVDNFCADEERKQVECLDISEKDFLKVGQKIYFAVYELVAEATEAADFADLVEHEKSWPKDLRHDVTTPVSIFDEASASTTSEATRTLEPSSSEHSSSFEQPPPKRGRR